MNKDEYIKIAQDKLKDNSKKIMMNQINNYYNAKEYNIPICDLEKISGIS